jgi:hypothetical protein
MTQTHTPGPWHLGLSHGPLTLTDHHRIAMHGSGSAAVYSMGCSAEESEANARLIAAAPDMLEALRDAECELFYASTGSINPEAVRDALAKVRAAMIRATS